MSDARPAPPASHEESRVLILAPTANDARLTAKFLADAEIPTEVCADIPELCRKVEEGCGALLLAEETLAGGTVSQLVDTLTRQPAWSDLPISIITGGGEVSQVRLRRLGVFGPGGNVTLLERPFRPATLVSTVEVALRARRRQYEVRKLLGDLRAGEERLLGILDSISDAFIALDADWRITYLNPCYLQLVSPLYQSAEELIGQNLWEKFPDIVDAESGRFYRRTMAEQKPGVFELFYAPVQAWLEVRAFPSATGLSIYVQNITGRKQAEAERTRHYDEAREAAHRLNLAMSAADLGDWVWDLASDMVTLSERAAEIFGIRPGTHMTRTEMRNLLHEEDRTNARLAAQKALEEETTYENEYRVRQPDGTLRWVAASGAAIHDETGKVTGMLGVVQDITNRKSQEMEVAELSRQVREQARLFDTALSNITDFAYTFDRSGRFIYANKPLLDLWGLTLDQAVGKNFFDLSYPAEQAASLQRQIEEVFESGRTVRDETAYTSPSGEAGFYEYIFSPVFDPEGQVEIVAGSTRIITERKKTEEALKEAKEAAEAANRSKDHFLAVLSHELRTPLTPVLMTASALETDATLSPALRADMALIRRNVELETKLIDDLLDLSRITSGKLALHVRATHLNEAVRQVCAICQQQIFEKGIRLEMELAENAGSVRADPARLQQVLWNLLKNAAKFTPAGGSIFLETSRSASGTAQVSVRDSGIGIGQEVLPKIFDAFEQGDASITRQFGGLGLGLAITKALVALHEGTIRAESGGVGQGSTFVVEWTSTSDEIAEAEAGAQLRSGDSLRILIAEDHADTAAMLARLLTATGYTVTVANTAAAALEIADQKPFDLVVSDIGLPDSTGYEFMRNLRARHQIPGIAMSGYGMEEDIQKSLEAGFSEHLVKPVNLSSLEQAIRRLAGR